MHLAALNIPVNKWVESLHSLPTELMWVILLLTCFSSLLLMLKAFGKSGLYAYIVVCFIAANIQVLKVVQFSVLPDPVALGTVLFATTFICTDILTEYYSAEVARKAVYLSLAGMLLMTLFMVLGLGFRPLSQETSPASMSWALPAQGHLAAIFTPTPALLISGSIAYLCSQLNDVWIFSLMKRLTKGKHLWLRNCGSTIVSTLIDNTIFSILAWIVFAEAPLSWPVVIFTYILGTYWIRVLLAFLDTPVIYLAKYFLPKKTN